MAQERGGGGEAEEVFYRVYDQCRYTMLHVAMGVLGDRHLAEDVVQDAFMTILRLWEDFREFPTQRTRNLALVITRNKAIDQLRRQRGDLPLEAAESVEEQGSTPEEALIEKQGYEELRAAMGELSEQYRIALELKYIYGYSDQEMAKRLDITPKNANVRVFRAKRALRELLIKRHQGEKEAQRI